MRTLLLTILTFLTLSSFGQQKVWTGDTTYWYNYQNYINKEIGIDDLSKSQHPFAFRITSSNIMINIWKVDGIKFSGIQTVFTSTSPDSQGKCEHYFKTEMIGEDTVQLIMKLLDDYSILSIPPEDSIADWGTGFHGTTYLIEYATPEIYSFKSYWTPTAFPSIPEAVRISGFVKNIEDLLMQYEKFDNLIESLPGDKNYQYGNALTKIRTKIKAKKRKKSSSHY